MRVVIVGAGISGLAACRHLKQNCKNVQVVILEARNRIGGRIYTTNEPFGYPIDLGAQFLHYHASNILYEMALQNKLKFVMAPEKNFPVIFDPDGQVTTEFVHEQWIKLEEFVMEHAYENFASLESDIDISTAFSNLLEKKGIKLNPQEKRIWNCYINDWFAGYDAADSNEIGAQYFFHNIEEKETSDDAVLPDGMGQIVQIISKGLDILLNHQVVRIEYGDKNRNVIVTTADGKQFECDKVLVTIPLGVLKRNKIEFIPPLPTNKLQAIKSIGFGSMSKVFLEFSEAEACWDKSKESFAILPSSDGKIRACYVLNWKRYTGKNMLIVFSSGTLARKMSYEPESKTIADIMKSLRVAYKNLANPIRYKIVVWDNDPFSFGAYAFNAIGTTPQMFADYEADINKKIYFAGEATSSLLFGYAHGAYETGIREAQKMLKHNKESSSMVHSRL
jgi:monoamine oxidase